MKSKLKLEIQYADYSEYEYPEPILFRFGVRDYAQNHPYIVNFPEKRGLVKYTRLMGSRTALTVKYQYSDIREDIDQHLAETKITHQFSAAVIGVAGLQVSRDTRGFTTYQPGVGCRWTLSPLTLIQADAQLYLRGADAVAVGGKMDALLLRLKVRQVLTISTALFVEYDLNSASGESISFTSHTLSVWLSQFLLTQTAIHANLRLYDNSMGIRSIAPSLEVAQYLTWNTILRAKYRYYTNQSDNVSLGESDVIIPDGLTSNAISVQLNRELSPAMQVYTKYRWYKSNQGIEMNTYLAGFVFSF